MKVMGRTGLARVFMLMMGLAGMFIIEPNRPRNHFAHLIPGAGRITSKGVGSSQPVAPNDTPAGRAQNRRVDINLSYGDRTWISSMGG